MGKFGQEWLRDSATARGPLWCKRQRAGRGGVIKAAFYCKHPELPNEAGQGRAGLMREALRSATLIRASPPAKV